MGEEREKTNPDYPVTPAWRPASHPGVRLPAPSLEPVWPPSSDGADPSRQPDATPQGPGRAPSELLRPISQSGYSLVPASQESIRPLQPRPASGPIAAAPSSQPAYSPVFVAPSVAPVAAARAPSATHIPVPVRPGTPASYRAASDGYLHPAAGVRPASGIVPAPGSGMGGPTYGASASRRAGDPTRLLPWLRDKNKRFKALSAEGCDAIFKFASLHRMEANTVLQPLHAPPTACFAITAGAAIVRIRRPNGSFREVDRFGPGDVVGFLALVDNGPSPYEIVTASSAEVIAFEADQLAQFAAALHPDALAAIKAWTPLLIDHMRIVQQRVSRLASARRKRIHADEDDQWKGIK